MALSLTSSGYASAVMVRTPIVAATTLVALGLVAAPTSARQLFVARTVTEPSASGLSVSGPLKSFVATATARVVVPTTWKVKPAKGGQLRYVVRVDASCGYDVLYSVRSAIAPIQDAADYVGTALPAQPRRIVDAGVRNSAAWRVVHTTPVHGRLAVSAMWAGVLTRRADIAPSGEQAWTEIDVSATARTGSVCHSGTWRDVLGPSVGDSLAVARTSLRFVKR